MHYETVFFNLAVSASVQIMLLMSEKAHVTWKYSKSERHLSFVSATPKMG